MTIPGASEAATANVILNANVSGFNQGMAQAAQQTGLLSRALNDVQRHLDGITGRMGHGLIHLAKGEFAYLGVATGLAATFEKQLGTLSAHAAVTGESFRGIKGAVETSFNKFPVSRASVVELTESLTTLGVKGPSSLNTLTQTFIKLGAATGEGSSQLATGLVQLSRLMGTSNATQITNYANSLLTVSAKAGVSATSVLNFSQAIAPLAKQAGIGTSAVLGISSAFTKVGADGFVAANFFNSLISQITTLSATGSPELAKFSNLIGKTVGEFKKMDKTDAFTQIIEAINKGGPQAVDTLNRLGYEGVRTLSSVQALASAGDLRGQISSALGASGDHKNLDKGAAAAFNNLTDSGKQLKNTLTQTGTQIGTSFLTPLSAVLKLTNSLAGSFRIFAPFRAVIGALAGAFALLAGSMLVVAAVSAKIALGGFVARSGPIGSLRAGLSRSEGPMTERQAAMVARPWNAPLYAAGQRGRGQIERGRTYFAERGARAEAETVARERAIVAGGGVLPMGRTVEQSAAVRAAQREAAGTVGQRIRALPTRGIASLITTQREFVNTAGTPGEKRPPGMMPRVAYQGQRLTNYLRGEPPPEPPVDETKRGGRLARAAATLSPQNQRYNESIGTTVKAEAKLTAATERLAAAEAADAKASTAHTVAQKEAATAAVTSARKTMVAATESQAALRKEAVAADASAIAQKGVARQAGILTIGFMRLQAATVGAAARTVGSGVATVAGGVSRMAKGVGLLTGLLVGVPLLMEGFKSIADKAHAAAERIGATLNPIAKYNDQLGIASTNLATFTAATADATKQLNGITATTSMKTAEHVSDADANLAQHGKSTDKTINAAYKKGQSQDEQQLTIQSLLRGYDLTKPTQVQLVKNNLLSAGFSRAAVQNSLTGITPGGLIGGTTPLDFGTIPKQVAATEGHGIFASNTSAAGSKLSDVGATEIGLAFNGNQDKYGPAYAGQKRLLDEAAFTAQSLKAKPNLGDTGGMINAKQVAGELSTMLGGGSKGAYLDAIIKAGIPAATGGSGGSPTRGGGRGGQAEPDFSHMSTDKLMQLVIDKVIPATDVGKRDLASVKSLAGGNTTTTKVKDMSTVLSDLISRGPGDSPDQLMLRRTGKLGGIVAGDKAILAAKADSQDPVKAAAAVKAMLADAQSLGHGFADTTAYLDQLIKGIADTNNAFSAVAVSAKALNLANQQAAIARMNRSGQFKEVAQTYVTAAKGYKAGSVKDDELASAKGAYDQEQIAQAQFQVSTYQSLLAYGVQKQRAEASFNLQYTNAQRDFRTSQVYAEADFHKQVLRENQDFAVQMERQAQSSAQSIYDPYARVQAKYTIDAGSLLLDLQDQNRRIAQQQNDLKKLKSLGVKQQTIDTLDLANPTNSQQASNLVATLMNDPALVRSINSAIATRLKSTASLTQSSFSMSYRNTTEDFRKQITRGAADFATATERAIAAQTLALSDMTKAFNVSATNSAQDLATAMRSALGNFGTEVETARNKMGPLLAQLPKDLQGEYRTAFREIAKDAADTATALALLGSGSGPTKDQGFGSSTSAEHNSASGVATPNGINPQGNYGYYTNDGKFHPLDSGMITGGIAALLPHIKAPGHAEGGISTREHMANFSEGNKPEVIIPLDNRGLQFMSGFATQVSMAMVRQMQTSQHPSMPSGAQAASTITYTVDQGNTFSGEVHVEASDPDALAKALAAKARLARLSRPARKA